MKNWTVAYEGVVITRRELHKLNLEHAAEIRSADYNVFLNARAIAKEYLGKIEAIGEARDRFVSDLFGIGVNDIKGEKT